MHSFLLQILCFIKTHLTLKLALLYVTFHDTVPLLPCTHFSGEEPFLSNGFRVNNRDIFKIIDITLKEI